MYSNFVDVARNAKFISDTLSTWDFNATDIGQQFSHYDALVSSLSVLDGNRKLSLSQLVGYLNCVQEYQTALTDTSFTSTTYACVTEQLIYNKTCLAQAPNSNVRNT